MAAAILGGLGLGAGVGVSTVALAPFNAANTFMGSAFFGYGMILGERYMYQADWPKIQARLENGEKIENIIQEYTGTFSAVVMKEAKIIFESVTEQFVKYIEQRLTGQVPPAPSTTAPPASQGQPFPQGTAPQIKQKIPSVAKPTAFLPPIVKLSNINSADISKAIGRVRAVKHPTITVHWVESQISQGKWVRISSKSSRTLAMTAASQAWRSPKYYPSFRNKNQDIYYFRIQ